MNIIENLTHTYKNGNTLIKLIYFNVVVFLFVNIVRIVLRLFNIDADVFIDWLAIPSNTSELIRHFWTPVTYMFLHTSFFHILFNMLMLYWFGQLFLTYFYEKQILSLYILGGLAAAFVYVAAYNIFPYYAATASYSVLMGASGSIMAIVVATAVRAPNAEMNLLLIGRVKLIYIALITVLISVFSLTGNNGGGEMAHLGGALAGYLFVVFQKKGIDISAFISKILDFFLNLYRPKPKLKTTKYNAQRMSPEQYNQKKAKDEAEIDRILDKIKTSGYESLNAEEKRKLFEKK
ncbi:MAG: Rhomboid family protein [Bacteroidetes bacterium]|nr:Rhomboid family protein [Bacteroidota bacterium]